MHQSTSSFVYSKNAVLISMQFLTIFELIWITYEMQWEKHQEEYNFLKRLLCRYHSLNSHVFVHLDDEKTFIDEMPNTYFLLTYFNTTFQECWDIKPSIVRVYIDKLHVRKMQLFKLHFKFSCAFLYVFPMEFNCLF